MRKPEKPIFTRFHRLFIRGGCFNACCQGRCEFRFVGNLAVKTFGKQQIRTETLLLLCPNHAFTFFLFFFVLLQLLWKTCEMVWRSWSDDTRSLYFSPSGLCCQSNSGCYFWHFWKFIMVGSHANRKVVCKWEQHIESSKAQVTSGMRPEILAR